MLIKGVNAKKATKLWRYLHFAPKLAHRQSNCNKLCKLMIMLFYAFSLKPVNVHDCLVKGQSCYGHVILHMTV